MKRVIAMCNLSEGIAERAWAEGETRGEARGANRIIAALKLLKDHLPLDKVRGQTGLTTEQLTELQALV